MNGFIKDTLIKTPSGYRKIQELKVDDVITGFNPLNNSFINNKIISIDRYIKDNIYKIRTIENKISCLNNTLILKSNNEVCKAKDIKDKFVVKVLDNKKEKVKFNAVMSNIKIEEQEVFVIKTQLGTFIADNFLILEK